MSKLQHRFVKEFGRKRCDVCRDYFPTNPSGFLYTGWWIVRIGNLRRRMCPKCHEAMMNPPKPIDDTQTKGEST